MANRYADNHTKTGRTPKALCRDRFSAQLCATETLTLIPTTVNVDLQARLRKLGRGAPWRDSRSGCLR
jgi:hypothetical protein